MIVVACILTFNYFIQFISRIFALTITLLIFSLTLEDTIGHLPSDEIDYVIKHPPVPSLTSAKELESLCYPDQRSKLQKLQEKLSPESPVSSPSLTSQGHTSISPDTKSMSFVFERTPTPDTMASEWSSQWSEDVQMPRSCSNSTINIPSRGKNKLSTCGGIQLCHRIGCTRIYMFVCWTGIRSYARGRRLNYFLS